MTLPGVQIDTGSAELAKGPRRAARARAATMAVLLAGTSPARRVAPRRTRHRRLARARATATDRHDVALLPQQGNGLAGRAARDAELRLQLRLAASSWLASACRDSRSPLISSAANLPCQRSSISSGSVRQFDHITSQGPRREPAAGPRVVRCGSWCSCSLSSRLCQPPLGRPPGQLVPGRQLELAQHRGDVTLDRLDRDVELTRDLLVGIAAGDQPQDLPLTGCQLVEFGVEGRAVRTSGGQRRERVEHEPGQPGREDRVAGRDPADRVHQLGAGDRLGHIAARAGPDDGNHVLRSVGGGQGEEAHLRVRGLDRRDDGMPAAAGQVHVKQHHIGQAPGDQRDRGLHVIRLADDLDLVAELGPDPGAEQAMIVNEDAPGPVIGLWPAAVLAGRAGRVHARLGWRSPAARGIVRDTSVPSPWAVRTVADPPRRVIRACTDSVSPFRSPGTARGSNPRPRSRTNSDTSAGSTSAKIDTTLAPDHFTALTVASRAAASRAARSSSRSQSPTVTASTATPCWASTSRWMSRTPPASVRPASSIEPGARPSNSQERSSGSCARASWPTCWGLSALRWIRASVCSTESCTRAAMSARSSARILACRSTTRSRAIRSHHGPSTTAIAAMTSATPPSGRSRAELSWADTSVLSPTASSRPAISNRRPVPDRPRPSVRPSSGSARCRMIACSSAGAFRQISTMPAALMNSGQISELSRPMPNTEAVSSTTISSDPRPAANAMPSRSALALLAILASAPAAGISSQATT